MKTLQTLCATVLLSLVLVNCTSPVELKENEAAPKFSSQLHTGAEFKLQDQRSKWTVLYFFPKSDTPGCTKQACAFRDNIKKITDLGAEVYGISMDSVAEQAAFHKKHGLNFFLISDKGGAITKAYGAKMPVTNMAQRWTFILDDQLVIRKIERDVDPITDADKVAAFITTETKK